MIQITWSVFSSKMEKNTATPVPPTLGAKRKHTDVFAEHEIMLKEVDEEAEEVLPGRWRLINAWSNAGECLDFL